MTQNVAIHDPANDGLQKLGVWNRIEIAGSIGVYDIGVRDCRSEKTGAAHYAVVIFRDW
jgi:hypothetical protein